MFIRKHWVRERFQVISGLSKQERHKHEEAGEEFGEEGGGKPVNYGQPGWRLEQVVRAKREFFFWYQLLHNFLLILTKKPGCREKLGDQCWLATSNNGHQSWTTEMGVAWSEESSAEWSGKCSAPFGNTGPRMVGRQQWCFPPCSAQETWAWLLTQRCTSTPLLWKRILSWLWVFFPSIMPCYNGFPPNVSDVTPTEHQKQKESWRWL